MDEIAKQFLQPYFNFWIYVIIMMIGLWAVIAKNNLIKKIIGLSIFQTAIILFYVSIGVKENSTIPILYKKDIKKYYKKPDANKDEQLTKKINSPSDKNVKKSYKNTNYMTNPTPHVLMLTAIVVGVATLGVSLSLCQVIFKKFNTIEESELLEKIKSDLSNE